MIMTIYLWHLTAFVFVMVAAWLLGGIGLHAVRWQRRMVADAPRSGLRYTSLALSPLIIYVCAFRTRKERPQAPTRRSRIGGESQGLLLVCTGLAATAAISIASPMGVTGVRLWVVALPRSSAHWVNRFWPGTFADQAGYRVTLNHPLPFGPQKAHIANMAELIIRRGLEEPDTVGNFTPHKPAAAAQGRGRAAVQDRLRLFARR